MADLSSCGQQSSDDDAEDCDPPSVSDAQEVMTPSPRIGCIGPCARRIKRFRRPRHDRRPSVSSSASDEQPSAPVVKNTPQEAKPASRKPPLLPLTKLVSSLPKEAPPQQRRADKTSHISAEPPRSVDSNNIPKPPPRRLPRLPLTELVSRMPIRAPLHSIKKKVGCLRNPAPPKPPRIYAIKVVSSLPDESRPWLLRLAKVKGSLIAKPYSAFAAEAILKSADSEDGYVNPYVIVDSPKKPSPIPHRRQMSDGDSAYSTENQPRSRSDSGVQSADHTLDDFADERPATCADDYGSDATSLYHSNSELSDPGTAKEYVCDNSFDCDTPAREKVCESVAKVHSWFDSQDPGYFKSTAL